MVTKLPSLLEFWSYIWYCQACALGVFFEFADYKRFVERTHEYKDVPSPILPSLKWFAQGLCCLVVFIVAGGYFPVDFCWDEKYWDMIFPVRILYYTAAMTAKRFFYYCPFLPIITINTSTTTFFLNNTPTINFSPFLPFSMYQCTFWIIVHKARIQTIKDHMRLQTQHSKGHRTDNSTFVNHQKYQIILDTLTFCNFMFWLQSKSKL